MSKIDDAVRRIDALIDDESSPQVMSLEESRDFYADLIEVLEARLAGVIDDLAGQAEPDA